VKFFDTAPAYGQAESYLGQALSSSPHVWTKVGTGVSLGNSLGSEVLTSVEQSLARLKRFHIDALLWHNWTADMGANPNFLECWHRLKQDSRICRLGASTYGPDDAAAAADSGLFDILQVEWNLLNQSVLGRLARCARRPLIALRSVYLQGILTERGEHLPRHLAGLVAPLGRVRSVAKKWGYPTATLALRAALDQPEVSWVVIGVRSDEELRHSLAATRAQPLSPEQHRLLTALDTRDPLTDPRTWVQP
jgi:aryl-alcohol dehydrogenase-like predicted oxidoreductase